MSRLAARFRMLLRSIRGRREKSLSQAQARLLKQNLRALLLSKQHIAERIETAA